MKEYQKRAIDNYRKTDNGRYKTKKAIENYRKSEKGKKKIKELNHKYYIKNKNEVDSPINMLSK